ncbi:hypothetical protein CRI94_00870 [Longibacter salinarum]|uniref:Stage II sporulation protein M n=1 Tax=Longibacter salinarum TaxID=1850348 RepID=A0A2A8D1P0_9BACT|nr:stage II sporulation protein M [Longibacter salinarum]PEN14879.1 hypothetical protein CRI94_00870 [Longibacter salinarum]
MREVAFVRRNADTWKEFERVLEEAHPDPDQLADLYIRLTDDLAYAQTYYPGSKTSAYLNELSTEVHQRIYKTKPVERGRYRRFWFEDVPAAVAGAKTELIVALLVFVGAMAIGILSSAYDPGFVRLILGDQYVNMTLANIESGDPMAVYKKMHQVDMFLGIALNNIRVSIYAFAAGLFFSVGTGFILLQNGVMIGAFHYLFVKHDLLIESLLVIYIHGMLELSAIVVAGAAGFVLGNGFLFPGTKTRRESFVESARTGAMILVGLIPIFVLAAFLEGFVTRLTGMPTVVSLLIIGISAAVVVGYFVVLPFYYLNRTEEARLTRSDNDPSLADLAPVGASVSPVNRR